MFWLGSWFSEPGGQQPARRLFLPDLSWEWPSYLFFSRVALSGLVCCCCNKAPRQGCALTFGLCWPSSSPCSWPFYMRNTKSGRKSVLMARACAKSDARGASGTLFASCMSGIGAKRTCRWRRDRVDPKKMTRDGWMPAINPTEAVAMGNYRSRRGVECRRHRSARHRPASRRPARARPEVPR